MKAANTGTALTPGMRAAVERLKAGQQTPEPPVSADQIIRDLRAKVAALEMVVADARALAKMPCPLCAQREKASRLNLPTF